MITTEANEFTSEIHNGGKNPHWMPLILHNGSEETWLMPELTEKDIKSLLIPFPANDMDAYIVNADFRKKNPH